uniref:Uncharacterized protein n=1 Tax=uncultured Thiotrichaceae bacterium TaxID=298394 RepID=A0A6S6UBQ4_9GAMM|nr:MAG: Unknown protein [uncultured Thiotrichaceae bacterium]
MKKVLATLLLSIGLILVTVYGVKVVKSYLALRHVEQNIKNPVLLDGWMTIPYLAETYHVPEDYLYKTLGIPEQGSDKHSLHYFRKNYFNGDLETTMMAIQTAIADYKNVGQP